MSATTDQRAAQRLTAILAAIEPTGTPADQRIRQALTVAARALYTSRDPHRAIRRVYGRMSSR